MFRSLTLTPCPLSQGAHCTQGQTERVLALLEVIAPALPARRPVRVQADRGIGCRPTLLAGLAARG